MATTPEDTTAELTITAEQWRTAHAYEDEFTRRCAWMLENVFTALVRRYEPGTDERRNVLRNFGQNLFNRGSESDEYRRLGKAWASFCLRKFEDKAADLAGQVRQGEIGERAAVEALIGYGFLKPHQAEFLLRANS